MRFATIKVNGTEKAGIVLKNGVLPIEALNAAKGTAWAEDVMSLIQKQQIPGLTKWYNAGGKEELESIPGLVPSEKVVYGPLYRNPKRIFATVYKGNIIKNLIMDCQSYTKYRPNETTGGIFVSWRRKEELPTGA